MIGFGLMREGLIVDGGEGVEGYSCCAYDGNVGGNLSSLTCL